jgi:molecular chaperone DnaK
LMAASQKLGEKVYAESQAAAAAASAAAGAGAEAPHAEAAAAKAADDNVVDAEFKEVKKG